MKRIFLFSLLIAHGTLYAQEVTRPFERFFEAGILLGVTNYSGDIAENSIELKQTRPGFGIYGRYHLSPQWGAKGHVYFGSIAGDDKNSESRQSRSVKFSTSIFEIGLVGEWKPLGRNRITETGLHAFHFTPYLFGGVGVTFANPEAEYYGPEERRDAVLRVPFPEPGLKKTFLTTPVGLGLRLDIDDRWIIGAEGGWRPVYNDYLDGVSVNGDPEDNDWYYFLGVTVSIVLEKRTPGNL
jgi:OOP family OmpA-OmpF porin